MHGDAPALPGARDAHLHTQSSPAGWWSRVAGSPAGLLSSGLAASIGEGGAMSRASIASSCLCSAASGDGGVGEPTPTKPRAPRRW